MLCKSGVEERIICDQGYCHVCFQSCLPQQMLKKSTASIQCKFRSCSLPAPTLQFIWHAVHCLYSWGLFYAVRVYSKVCFQPSSWMKLPVSGTKIALLLMVVVVCTDKVHVHHRVKLEKGSAKYFFLISGFWMVWFNFCYLGQNCRRNIWWLLVTITSYAVICN